MVDPSVDAAVPSEPRKRRRSIFGRIGDWLCSQRHFHLKLLSGATVGVVVIILMAGIFLLVTLRNHYQDSLRTHTIEVMRLSSLIENDIAGLESGHRGYLLSGSEDFLIPFQKKREYLLTGEINFIEAYKRAVADFYTYNGYLSILVANSPSQAQLLAEIRSNVERWINKSAVPQMDFKRAGKDAEALASIGACET